MGKLFDRRCTVQMGTVMVSGLRVQFKIEKSDQPTPSHATITVWNLARTTRTALLALPVPLVLRAGYGLDTEQLFNGDIAPSGVSVSRDGADWLTTFKVGDGLRTYQTERIQLPVPPNTNVQQLLTQAMSQIQGVDTRKALSDLQSGKLPILGQFQQLMKGSALSGRTMDEVHRVAKSAGYKASVVDGQLELTPSSENPAQAGAWPTDMIPDLTPETGLIGSPEPSKDKLVKIRCLLRPAIKPNRMFRVVSEAHLEGLFMRAKKVTHIGDTRGQEWYSDIEGHAL